MEPSQKSPEIENVLRQTFKFDRRDFIRANKCVPAPIGCGKTIDPETEFRDEVSRKEFTVTGMCQDCQDKMFGSGSPED